MSLLLHIAVIEEDRVIHSNGELQNCNERHRYEGYLALEYVCSEVINDRYSNINKEDDRYKERVSHEEQDHKSKSHCDNRIYRSLLHDKILRIGNNSGHTRQQTSSSRYTPDSLDGIHCLIRGTCRIEEDEHQAALSVS